MTATMFFQEIIYKDLSPTQVELAKNLALEILDNSENLIWTEWKSNIPLSINKQLPLVLVKEKSEYQKTNIYEKLYSEGSPFFIEWENFIREPTTVLTTFRTKSSQTVALAFLPPYFENLLLGIFSLYGYNIEIAKTPEELEIILKNRPDYLLFDIDMKEIDSNKRTKIIKNIRNVSKSSPGFAVNVVKDFDAGSLYDDICSPVKDFCDLLLSHEEYIVFILRFLYGNEIDKTLYNQKEKLEAWFEKLSCMNLSEKPLKNLFNGLMNPKKTYYRILRLQEELESLHSTRKDVRIELQHTLLSWMVEYIIEKDEKHERSTFTFLDSPPTEPAQPARETLK
ncbi:MAG: hypothetical protein ABUK01_04875 [Leptospirales bacterium]